MYKIFVSYSKEDLPMVRDLTSILHYPGVGIFVAEDRIKAGDTLWPDILKYIDGSDIVLAFISKHSLISSSCNNEIGYALKARKKIAPIIIGDKVTPPSIISHIKYIDFANDRNKSFTELEEIIRCAIITKEDQENIQTIVIVVLSILFIIWALKSGKK